MNAPRPFILRFVDRCRDHRTWSETLWQRRGQQLAAHIVRNNIDLGDAAEPDAVKQEQPATWLRGQASRPPLDPPPWGRNFSEAVAQLVTHGRFFEQSPVDMDWARDTELDCRLAEDDRTHKQQRWRALYLGQPAPQDPAFDHAFDVWRRYYFETEDYDRGICTGPIHRGSIMPATNQERVLSSVNARKRRDKALSELDAVDGVTNEVSERARRAAMELDYLPPEKRAKA